MVESVRAHWFLALTTIAFVSSGVAVIATRPAPEKKLISVEKSKSPRIHSCGGSRAFAKMKRSAPVIDEKPDGAAYRDVLLTVRRDLEKCTHRAPENVAYRVSVNVGPNGRVENLEMKAESTKIANVDMHVVACVNKVISPLQFPRGEGTNRVTARLSHD